MINSIRDEINTRKLTTKVFPTVTEGESCYLFVATGVAHCWPSEGMQVNGVDPSEQCITNFVLKTNECIQLIMLPQSK